MSDDKKSCGATLISFRLFSSPEFLVKFTHSIKFPRLRQTRSTASCRAAHQAPDASDARAMFDFAIMRNMVEMLTAWNKISSGN
jgi:hypothetical protein